MAEPDPMKDFHEYGAHLNSREIFLHNHYDSEDNENPGVEYRMASTFIKNLRTLDMKANAPITIHCHSIGGEWADCMAIYDAIALCRSFVSIIIYGQAESASSIFMQAADHRYMTEHAHFMCHYGSTDIVDGTEYLNAVNQAEFERKSTNIMMGIYAKRCVDGKFFIEKFGKKPSEKQVQQFLIRKLKSGDWYLNAEEAVYYGFADEIITDWHSTNE